LLPLCGQKIAGVKLVGSDQKIQWTHDEDGLTIQPPSEKPGDHAFAFEITFEKPKEQKKK